MVKYHIVEIEIEISTDCCRELYDSLMPDNNDLIKMQCSDKSLDILIKDAKISSIYNLVDDFIRDYETFIKIKKL